MSSVPGIAISQIWLSQLAMAKGLPAYHINSYRQSPLLLFCLTSPCCWWLHLVLQVLLSPRHTC